MYIFGYQKLKVRGHMKMTITRWLAEIKLLDSRIKKQTAEAVFTDCKNARNKVTAMKHMEEKALVEHSNNNGTLKAQR